MKLHFCGAAESVTGSCHLLRISPADAPTGGADVNILLDCGQFQGSASQDAQNYEPFPFDPAEVDFLILSHAHIDHCGRIPLLVKRGFSGRIFCTDATADLLPIMLRDSAHIHEMEAEWKSKKNERAGKPPVQPLYTMADAEAALPYVSPVLYGQLAEPVPGVKFVFNDAGHILGSAIIELFVGEGASEKKLVFTGDLGAAGRPLLNDPTTIKRADYVIMETTYGDRVHEGNEESLKSLADIIEKTKKRGGAVIIPSFAVGRTQELLYELDKYAQDTGRGLLEGLAVYVDSPMASAATEAFRENSQDFDEEAKRRMLAGDDPLDFPGLAFTKSTEESKALNLDPAPKIIISASGMCEAGRIRHHLKHHLWDPKASIVFVGYQAEGTLGRRLIEGAQTVKLFDEEIAVRAEICNLQGFSAHADRDGLLAWVRGFKAPPEALFLVHGEEASKRAFAATVEEATGIRPFVVERMVEVDLGEGPPAAPAGAPPAGSKVDPEDAEDLARRIGGVKDNLDDLLYAARMRIAEEADRAGRAGDAEGARAAEEKYAALKNVLVSLEKDTMQLARQLAEKDKDADKASVGE